METLGTRKFVEIPGTSTLDLPPLLVKDVEPLRHIERVMDMAAKVVDNEDLVPNFPLDQMVPQEDVSRRKLDMAVNIIEMYKVLNRHWNWGDGILEWIRQCEITFEGKPNFRPLLRPDIWPHAGRSSFVTLLEDKDIHPSGVDIEQAVGLRLTFRHLPKLSDFSDQFLLYLNHNIAETAFQTWAAMTPSPLSALPPERFEVHVVMM